MGNVAGFSHDTEALDPLKVVYADATVVAVLNGIVERLERIEKALKSGAIGAWGNEK